MCRTGTWRDIALEIWLGTLVRLWGRMPQGHDSMESRADRVRAPRAQPTFVRRKGGGR